MSTQAERDFNAVTAKAKYGDNHWWEAEHPATRAYWQLQEDVLLYPSFRPFHQDVEAALGRPVYTHEFAEPEKLLEEMRAKG